MDLNGETEFDLVRLIIGQVFECPKLARAMI